MKFIVLSMVMHRNIMPQILWETKIEIRKWSHSVMSDYLWLRGLLPTRIPCPWDFPGKSTRVACHFLLQGIFLTQGPNPSLLHCKQTLYHLSHQGTPSQFSAFSEYLAESGTWLNGLWQDGILFWSHHPYAMCPGASHPHFPHTSTETRLHELFERITSHYY